MIGIIDWDNSETGQPLLNDLINLIESTYNFKDLELCYTVTNILLKDQLTNEDKTVLKRMYICNSEWMKENYYDVVMKIDKMLWFIFLPSVC